MSSMGVIKPRTAKKQDVSSFSILYTHTYTHTHTHTHTHARTHITT